MVKRRQEGEYKKQSLVSVEMDAFQASLFAPGKLKAVETATPGVLAQARDDVVEEQYIVTTRRIQGTWEVEVQHVGDTVLKLPGKVVERIIAQRNAIIKEGRKEAARNRLNRIAEADQRAAERDPTDADVANFLGRDS